MVVKKKTVKVEAVVLDPEKRQKLRGKLCTLAVCVCTCAVFS